MMILFGFMFLLGCLGLLRFGFHEGGNIITAGAMADFTVNLPLFFFGVVGFTGVVLTVFPFVEADLTGFFGRDLSRPGPTRSSSRFLFYP